VSDETPDPVAGATLQQEPAVQAPHTTVHVIATREEYLAAVDAIAAGHGPIAIDAERASGYRYSQRAYLIQIFRRGAGTFLFDPPAIGSFTELNDAIGDEEWILHAASQDLTCLREIGLSPTRIYDTELAARLAGLPRVGLGTVVEDLLGIHLAKEHSAADWSTRPLPQAWLVYAALDVELLVDLREKMGELLEADGKTFIADQEFASVALRDFTIVRVEPWRRLTGLASIRGQRGLAGAGPRWGRRAAPPTTTRGRSTRLPAASSPTPPSPRQRRRSPRRNAISRPSRSSRAARAGRSSTAGGQPSNAAWPRPTSPLRARPASPSRHRAPGRIATPMRTSVSRPLAPLSPSSPSSSTSPSRTS
jgi:ribonuclease D